VNLSRRLLIPLFCTFMAVTGLWAQSFHGGIRGTVTDSSGAAVGTAKLTLTEQATGITRSTVSETGGGYSFPDLNPSTYSISVEKPGFKVLDRQNILVSTQEFLIVDLKLQVGAVTESVNVTAESVPLLETENASTGQVIDNQKLADLPNMGRNPFFEGVKISQNVTPGGDPKFNRMEDQTGSSEISIAGGPITGNNYLLDGIPITDSGNHAVIIPSIEAVQEVKLQVNTYDAEVGRTGGGTFNLYLKSGTNQLHGDVFGYTWVQPLLANTYFADAAGRNASGALNSPVANQPFYNYGAAIGGPVVVPKLYNGRNKTFFWVAGESYRQKEAASTELAVPTALEREGNFSQSFTKSGALQLMYDPAPTGRVQFPGNIIPTSMLNPVGLALASYYPLPNAPTPYYGAANYNTTAIIYDRADQVDTKLDQEITRWWRASVSYLHYGSREESNAYFGYSDPGTPGQSMLVRHVDATQANTTLTPSPTVVVSLRWGFNRYPNRTYMLASQGINLSALGFPQSYASSVPYDAFPAITMSSDMASYGGSGFSQDSFYSHSFSGSVSKFLGRHSLKTGVDFRAIHVAGLPTVTPGAYTFTSAFTGASATSTVAGTGGSLASLLLGIPSSGSVTEAIPVASQVDYWGFWVQDDFRFNSKLTLNFGIRYDYETGLHSSNNSLVEFDPNVVNPIQSQVSGITTRGEIVYAGTNGFTTATHPNSDKFGPRAGLAYAINSKTSIRGGYGLLWAPFTFTLFTPIGYNNATPYVASTNNNVSPANTLSNPFPTGFIPPAGNALGSAAGLGGQTLTVYDGNAHSTRIHQFSLDIQRELGEGFMVVAGYSGSVTHDLIEGTPNININQLPDADLSLGKALNNQVPNPFYGTGAGILNLASATVAMSQLLLPFPQYGPINEMASNQNHASYNSVYVKFQKRLGNGLNLLSTTTWSRNMDGSNAASNTFSAQQSAAQDNYNLAPEYSLATINTPLRWTTAINYQLPFGAGRKFLSTNRYLDLVAGGWAINVQTTLQSGFPLAIYQSNLNSAIGTSVQRPNATGAPEGTSGSETQRLSDWINPAAFTTAAQYTYGNVSRTTPLRGPAMKNADFSMFKTWAYKEHLKGQFRMEVFNLTNTPYFYAPGADGSNTGNEVGSAQFGQISLQANFPRVFQVGVRLMF
jgi:hypothetical protein